MNIAYTEAYAAWQRQCDDYFAPQYLLGQPEVITQLSDGFSVRSRYYSGEKDGYPCVMSENELLNSNEEVIHTWRNLDSIRSFVSLFQHQNGKHYLIFHIELYGYSVLEIESGRVFHYIPSQSHPQDKGDFEETFIWADVLYDPNNNLLAVEGCFWAAPYSVLIVDFTQPFLERPAETWIDIHAKLDPDYALYGHIDFDHWKEDGDLCIQVCDAETDDKKELCLSVDTLRIWLSE